MNTKTVEREYQAGWRSGFITAADRGFVWAEAYLRTKIRQGSGELVRAYWEGYRAGIDAYTQELCP
jgi:ribosome modulation factor